MVSFVKMKHSGFLQAKVWIKNQKNKDFLIIHPQLLVDF